MTMVRRAHATAPDDRFSGHYRCCPASASLPGAVRSRADVPPARSRFEGLATLAAAPPATGADLLGILLASTFPAGGGGCEVLRPLWAEEAMHRAFGFVRLVHARNAGVGTGLHPTIAGLERVVARDLVARYRELEVDGDRETRLCATVLHDVVAGLGVLFGRPSGVIVVAEIEALPLPSYKRRALVLAANELVVNSLLHAFPGRQGGVIEISLTVRATESACLRVVDDGIGYTDAGPNLDCGVAAGLAGLLEADLEYQRKSGRTSAEIAFPLSGS
jgi:hypothetical protein